MATDKKAPKPALTQERLKKLLHYEPSTGVFIWLVRAGPRLPGSVAGGLHPSPGGLYWGITIEGCFYYAHQLAFLYMTGTFVEEGEHRDTIGTNNAWSNLRPCTSSQNTANRKRPKHNTSGVKGVFWEISAKKWRARIYFQRKSFECGLFDDIQDAAKAREIAVKRIHGGFARIS